MTARLMMATLLVLTLVGCRDEPSREDVEATAEEVLSNVETPDDLEAATQELVELESRIPIEDRSAAGMVAQVARQSAELLEELR